MVEDRRLTGLVGNRNDWRTLLKDGMDEMEAKDLQRRLLTGRPLGSPGFVRRLEKRLGRGIVVGKAGWPKGRRRKA